MKIAFFFPAITLSITLIFNNTNSSIAITESTTYNTRYCEILLATFAAPNQINIDVYNTRPCNLCPQQDWDELDFNAIAEQNNVNKAIANGPRYTLMDKAISNVKINPCTDQFGDLVMTKVATLNINPLKQFGKKGYQEQTVNRNTIFFFKAGREVYTLKSPEGKCYIMQSYSQIIDKSLKAEQLKTLDDRLDLPKGWLFEVVQLEKDLEVTCENGKAVVVQDDLKNTYQYLHEGCLE